MLHNKVKLRYVTLRKHERLETFRNSGNEGKARREDASNAKFTLLFKILQFRYIKLASSKEVVLAIKNRRFLHFLISGQNRASLKIETGHNGQVLIYLHTYRF